ncbi:MAG: hypothetical protein R3181_01625 [Rubricoccaceae bacterium]|nr:hypothetical protein [Rubricoccaceae bacterium]
MQRLVSVWGRLLLTALALTGCGGATDEAPPPDPELVAALVPLHLADARAEATGESRDSLRAAAYAHARRATGLDSAALAARLDAVAGRPAEAAVLFQSLQDSLALLRP